MPRKDKNKKTVKKSRSASAENREKITKELLSATRSSAGVEEVSRLIREGADVNSAEENG